MIERIAVIIPARDEAAVVARCLDSVVVAAGRVSHRLPVSIVLVADSCTDQTAAIASSFDGVTVVETTELEGGNVGAARALGVATSLGLIDQRSAAAELENIWIANTDADSVVPVGWLVDQLSLANSGADVIVGTVTPDFSDLDDELIAAWKATRTPGEPNGHVHGANLGIRASNYVRAGGYGPLAEHEDVDLVERLRRDGAMIVASEVVDVETSGRRAGRTPGGYSRYLHNDLRARSAVSL